MAGPLPPPPGAEPAPPPRFALAALAERYELLGELGQGGMAVVYHARERPAAAGPGAAPGREVAIKVVSSRHAGDADALRRFAREARTVAGLDHPNVVRTLAIEEVAGEAVAIVSEYVPGQTLRRFLRDAGGPLAFDAAGSVLRDLASALAYAHARRLVHRDVKPENAFLAGAAGPGRPGRALLADFGIARPLDADAALTVHGAALGTPAYMAPEQVVGGPVDERTDVYALALVGWEMLAGRRPWEGETLYGVLHKQQFDTLPDLAAVRPDIPAYLLDAVRGGLAKDPAARWRDGAEFLDRLTPRAQPLPALPEGPEGAEAATHEVAGETVRVPTPAHPTAPVGAGDWPPPGVVMDDVPPLPGPPARAASPARRRRLVGLAVAGVLAAAVAAGGVLAARTRADDRARAADAAATGVSDAELAELLRAANARVAPAPVAPAPAPAPGVGAPAVRPAPAAPRPAARPPAPARTPLRPAVDRAPAAAATPAVAPARSAALVAAGDPRCGVPESAAQRACLMGAVERQDVALNGSYRQLIAVLRARAGGAAEPPAVRELRAEQRAWVDARDRQCRAALAGREGARWGAARAPCFAALSARRAAEFDARRARLDGQPPA